MSVNPSELSKFADQKVIVQINLDKPNDKGETLVEVEGTALAANEMGILLKPKGKTQAELVEAAKIEGVVFAPQKEKEIKAKTLQPIKYGQARSHLLERHGATLTDVNGLTEEQALDYHTELNHAETDLGHVHGDKAQTERAEAIAEAGEGETVEEQAEQVA